MSSITCYSYHALDFTEEGVLRGLDSIGLSLQNYNVR